MTLVVDSSGVLAFLLGEPGGERLSQETGPLLLSTVNLTEVLTADHAWAALDVGLEIRLIR